MSDVIRGGTGVQPFLKLVNLKRVGCIAAGASAPSAVGTHLKSSVSWTQLDTVELKYYSLVAAVELSYKNLGSFADGIR